MEQEFPYPLIARPTFMLMFFAISLALFHLLFVKLVPLTKLWWKRMDYVWLGLAALGIVGSANDMRRLVAQNYANIAANRVETRYHGARQSFEVLAGPAVCRRFERSEFSPENLEEIQEELDEVCAFGRAALEQIPRAPPADGRFPVKESWPNVSDEMLKQMLADIRRQVHDYETLHAEYRTLKRDATYSPPDEVLLFFSPFLFAVALALRLTKVTGELRTGA